MKTQSLIFGGGGGGLDCDPESRTGGLIFSSCWWVRIGGGVVGAVVMLTLLPNKRALH